MTVRSVAVTVGTTRVRLSAVNNRGNVTAPSYTLVQNTDGAASVFIGGDDVTDANGMELEAGQREWFVLVQEALWGVVTSGTVNVRVLETQR